MTLRIWEAQVAHGNLTEGKKCSVWALWKYTLYFKSSVWGSSENVAKQFSQTLLKRLRIAWYLVCNISKNKIEL